jgi:sugar transferase (PEP-CTERM system associated)
MIRLFKVSIPGNVIALMLSEAILVFCCYVLAAYWVLDESPDVFLMDDGGLWHVAGIVGVILLGLYFQDLYENFRIRSRILLIQQMCMILGMAFLLQALANYGRWTFLLLPKWMMVYGSVMVLIVVPLWRMLFASVVMNAVGARQLLFLGSSPVIQQIVQRVGERSELGLAAMGYLAEDPSADAESDLTGTPKLGTLEDLDAVLDRQVPDSIIVGLKERRNRLPVERLLDLRYSGIRIEDAAATYETLFGRVSTRDLRPSQLIFAAELGPSHTSMHLQSLYSWVIAAIGVVLTAPVMVVVALVVKLGSRGPILFRQSRVGLNGSTFTLYKFRSMRTDAEAKTGAVWASKDDPRVTPNGKWLRKLRLDELPQLFNVLKGEMSIVGPRPERPEFVAKLQEEIPYYRQRHCVKPGISGWAQINHKYGNTMEDVIIKLEFDLYYIKNMAVSLDAYIMFHTAKTMLLGRGAQ